MYIDIVVRRRRPSSSSSRQLNLLQVYVKFFKAIANTMVHALGLVANICPYCSPVCLLFLRIQIPQYKHLHSCCSFGYIKPKPLGNS